MCARCPSTVRSDRKRAAATSRFVLPSATSAATRSSAGVSAPRRRRAAADPLQLRTRTFRPEGGADALEDRQRLAQASRALPGAASCGAVQRPTRAASDRDRVGAPPAGGGRVPHRRARSLVDPPVRGVEQSPAAGAVGERGRALEPSRIPLVPVEELARPPRDDRARSGPPRNR